MGRALLAFGGACALVLLTLVGVNASDGTANPSPTNTGGGPASARIVIRGFAISPAKLRVAPGTKVTVVNRDALAHTVTATDGMAFSTGIIMHGAAHTFTAPSTPGDYEFLCTLYSCGKGTLTVS